ncbi:hypothetical protein BD779DRAFT_1681645 [Infundibulicybe gibba]|nr:hypothetical protein BD779DRAFT_1681645 [Infundibulicybe gibba]
MPYYPTIEINVPQQRIKFQEVPRRVSSSWFASPWLAWPDAIRKPHPSRRMLVSGPNEKPEPQPKPAPRIWLAQWIDEPEPTSTERAEQQPIYTLSTPYAVRLTISPGPLTTYSARAPDPQVGVEFPTNIPKYVHPPGTSADPWSAYRCDSPAPVIPPFIPGREYDAPTPYMPAQSPANGDYTPPPLCACYHPGAHQERPVPRSTSTFLHPTWSSPHTRMRATRLLGVLTRRRWRSSAARGCSLTMALRRMGAITTSRGHKCLCLDAMSARCKSRSRPSLGGTNFWGVFYYLVLTLYSDLGLVISCSALFHKV